MSPFIDFVKRMQIRDGFVHVLVPSFIWQIISHTFYLPDIVIVSTMAKHSIRRKESPTLRITDLEWHQFDCNCVSFPIVHSLLVYN